MNALDTMAKQRPSPSNAHKFPSFEVGSECWNELTASAAVRVTTKVERVLPAMLMELYRLTVDVIIAEAKKRAREGKEAFSDAIHAMFPGARKIAFPAVSQNHDLVFMST